MLRHAGSRVCKRPGIQPRATKRVAIDAAQLPNFTCPLRRKAREHILRIGIHIMPIELGRRKRTVNPPTDLPK